MVEKKIHRLAFRVPKGEYQAIENLMANYEKCC